MKSWGCILISTILTAVFAQKATATGAVCVQIDPKAVCPQTKHDAAIAAAIKTQDELSGGSIDVALDHGDKSDQSLGFDAIINKDQTIIGVPLGVFLSDSFALAANVPWIKTSDAHGLGNVLFMGQFYLGRKSKTFSALTALGVRTPTGGADVVGPRRAYDLQVQQSVALTIKNSRYAVNGLYIKPRPDNLGQTKGFTSTLLLGVDQPWWGQLNYYGAFFGTKCGADRAGNETLNLEALQADLKLGLVSRAYDVRVGITLPVYTKPTAQDFETGRDIQRPVSLDAGMRFNL